MAGNPCTHTQLHICSIIRERSRHIRVEAEKNVSHCAEQKTPQGGRTLLTHWNRGKG